eukprot:m.196328 g.196328  ORF g.196328 m.196328 type:complete len:1038 (+) comp15698_c1_seq4:348-3461(+)
MKPCNIMREKNLMFLLLCCGLALSVICEEAIEEVKENGASNDETKDHNEGTVMNSSEEQPAHPDTVGSNQEENEGKEHDNNIVPAALSAEDEGVERVEGETQEAAQHTQNNTDVSPDEGIKEQEDGPEALTIEDMATPEDDIIDTTHEDLSFEEWKERVHVKEIQNVEMHRRRDEDYIVNYAHVDCGAQILGNTKSTKNQAMVLTTKPDQYMMSPCEESMFLIMELCDEVQVHMIEITNQELFSGSFDKVRVLLSDDYPLKKDSWKLVETFTKKDKLQKQLYRISEPSIFSKYLRLEFELEEKGRDDYLCTITSIKVFGVTMMEEYKSIIKAHEVAEDEDIKPTDAPDAETPTDAEFKSISLYDMVQGFITKVFGSFNEGKDTKGASTSPGDSDDDSDDDSVEVEQNVSSVAEDSEDNDNSERREKTESNKEASSHQDTPPPTDDEHNNNEDTSSQTTTDTKSPDIEMQANSSDKASNEEIEETPNAQQSQKVTSEQPPESESITKSETIQMDDKGEELIPEVNSEADNDSELPENDKPNVQDTVVPEDQGIIQGTPLTVTRTDAAEIPTEDVVQTNRGVILNPSHVETKDAIYDLATVPAQAPRAVEALCHWMDEDGCNKIIGQSAGSRSMHIDRWDKPFSAVACAALSAKIKSHEEEIQDLKLRNTVINHEFIAIASEVEKVKKDMASLKSANRSDSEANGVNTKAEHTSGNNNGDIKNNNSDASNTTNKNIRTNSNHNNVGVVSNNQSSSSNITTPTNITKSNGNNTASNKTVVLPGSSQGYIAKLDNKIRILERNMSLSGRFLEQMRARSVKNISKLSDKLNAQSAELERLMMMSHNESLLWNKKFDQQMDFIFSLVNTSLVITERFAEMQAILANDVEGSWFYSSSGTRDDFTQAVLRARSRQRMLEWLLLGVLWVLSLVVVVVLLSKDVGGLRSSLVAAVENTEYPSQSLSLLSSTFGNDADADGDGDGDSRKQYHVCERHASEIVKLYTEKSDNVNLMEDIGDRTAHDILAAQDDDDFENSIWLSRRYSI